MSGEVPPTAELKCCPFCGRENDIYHPLYRCDHTLCGGGYLIACGCRARGPERPSEAEAIAAWNTRTVVTGELQGLGVPASPSGYSAEPEPSCTVSAVPVSIPNAAGTIRQMRADLSQYDFLLPDDYVPEPAWRKRWFRWGPAFTITDDMLVWAGQIARARSLMDLEAAASAIEARRAATENTGAVNESATRQGDAQRSPTND